MSSPFVALVGGLALFLSLASTSAETLVVCFSEFEPAIFRKENSSLATPEGSNGPVDLTMDEFEANFRGVEAELVLALALTKMGVARAPVQGRPSRTMVFRYYLNYFDSMYATRMRNCDMSLGAYIKSADREICGCNEVLEGNEVASKNICCMDMSIAHMRDGYAAITPLMSISENVIQNIGQALNTRLFFGLSILALTLLISGHLIWWAERKRNPEMFPDSYLDGVDDGLWWSTVTMTTVGYGDKAPITFSGRLIGVIWMFVGLGVYGIFSGLISSVLTSANVSQKIEPVSIKHISDLRGAHRYPICTLTGAYQDFLEANRLNMSMVNAGSSGNYEECYEDLKAGRAKTIIGDRSKFLYDASPLAATTSNVNTIMPGVSVSNYLQAVSYAIFLPKGSSLTEEVDAGVAGLAHEHDEVYNLDYEEFLTGWTFEHAVQKYLGDVVAESWYAITIMNGDPNAMEHASADTSHIIVISITVIAYGVYMFAFLFRDQLSRIFGRHFKQVAAIDEEEAFEAAGKITQRAISKKMRSSFSSSEIVALKEEVAHLRSAMKEVLEGVASIKKSQVTAL